MDTRKGSAGENNLLIASAADGTSVRAEVEGQGRVILILHPGMDTGKSYAQVAARLARRYRVIRLHRRQYRLDLKSDPDHGSPCTVAEEVEHVLAIVKAVGTPVFLFGHSSGGPVALETLVAAQSLFAGAMIYEPASVINSTGGLHLSGDWIKRDGEVGEGLRRARQALVSGKPGAAIGIFTQITAGWPSILANPAGALTALVPAYRKLIPCQIDDLEAMERLGLRLEAYSKLSLPVAMVCGERSPSSNKEMVAAVAAVLPMVERITLSRQGHACHVLDPDQLARVIERFADRIFE
ncbi:MAG TPA: alpha/beta hydrolase [Anaerolineales bacterium]|nr:alpha/beta hydrolase [Anaerolineales bacterium]